jgi:hypothetical protein
VWVSSALLLGLAACASDSAWRDGRFTHTELGGSIGDFAAIEPGWEPERAPDATLAFRHADGSRASWLRECRAAEVQPKALGRALWIALPGAEIEESSAREVASAPAWELSGRAQAGALGLRIATITRVAPRCEDSWMLVVPHAELHHRDAFEQWVRGFADEPAR